MDAGSIRIKRYGRFWEVRDAAGELICICVYKRGALEVARRLSTPDSASILRDAPSTRPVDNDGAGFP
jgi:hypothetical protein